MNTLESTVLSRTPAKPWMATASDLRVTHHGIVAGDAMSAWADVDPAKWADFANYWNRLTLDQFMGDGGTYRLRRYGQFEHDRDGQLRQLPHSAYEQARCVNWLNGGIARVFDPLEPGFARHAVLHRVLKTLTDIIDTAEGIPARWNVKLHPYRILATTGIAGQPTPEGLHRDGVDYVVVMMVQRNNIVGGESIMTDVNREPLGRLTLEGPMHTMILNDALTLHAVTPVMARDPARPAYRDVLVIAFEKVRAD